MYKHCKIKIIILHGLNNKREAVLSLLNALKRAKPKLDQMPQMAYKGPQSLNRNNKGQNKQAINAEFKPRNDLWYQNT